jgi:hypothetical protein|tara:strand:- start:212 stop:925 length:714 start_codon:yes stop_codon:yes gene_type:complete
MNCTELDLAVEEGMKATQTDLGFGIIVVSTGLASLALLLFGERIARALAGIIAFGGTAVFLFVVTSTTVASANLPCLARVIISVTGGLSVAALAWCLLKGGLFVLGGAAFGSVAHFVYYSIPLARTHNPPFVILGQSGYYYITVGVAGLAGAIVSLVMKKQFMRLTSSLIGGGGLALTTHLVAERSGEDIPSIVLVFIMLISTGLGVVSQHFLSKYKKKSKKRSRRRRRRNDDSDDE